MSGTQDTNSFAQNSESQIEEQTQSQSGIEQDEEPQEKLTSSQKMDQLLRGTSSTAMQKEIQKLRNEAAKYRTSLRNESRAKNELQSRSDVVQKELDVLKESYESLNKVRKLDNAGCIKSDLVAKDIPSDCKDVDAYIQKYKRDNPFLFNAKKQNLGGAFKPSNSINLTPSQQMDQYIRSALGH